MLCSVGGSPSRTGGPRQDSQRAAFPYSTPGSVASWSSLPVPPWESACLILLGLMLRDHCVRLWVPQFPHQRHTHPPGTPLSTPEEDGVRWFLDPVFFSSCFLGGGGCVPWGLSLGGQKACLLWAGAPLCPTHCVANPQGASWTEAIAFSLNSECCNLVTSSSWNRMRGL